jgi:hypothetical protein
MEVPFEDNAARGAWLGCGARSGCLAPTCSTALPPSFHYSGRRRRFKTSGSRTARRIPREGVPDAHTPTGSTPRAGLQRILLPRGGEGGRRPDEGAFARLGPQPPANHSDKPSGLSPPTRPFPAAHRVLLTKRRLAGEGIRGLATARIHPTSPGR